MNNNFSTKKVSDKLLLEIKNVLENLDFGSIELYVQDSIVTQITKRHITKTNSAHKRQLPSEAL